MFVAQKKYNLIPAQLLRFRTFPRHLEHLDAAYPHIMFIKPEELCIKNFYEALQRITVEVWQRLMHPGIKKMQSFESIILQKRPVAEWKINELTLVALHY